MPAALNAANEIALSVFVQRRINFPQISAHVSRVMDRHKMVAHPTLDQILAADA